MRAGEIERKMEKWDLAHNGLPSDIKDCFVRLKRLSRMEIEMLARSSRKRTSESDFSVGPAKRKFKRIVLPNDNSEDEDGVALSAANGNSSQEVEVPKISIDEAKSLSSRKSEVDGEKVTEAVKMSDLSHSRRGSQELRNNLAGMGKVNIRKSETGGENVTEAINKSDSSNCSGGSQNSQKNSSEMRKISDRKSEVNGEKVTEAVKKSDLSHSRRESQELKNNFAGMRKVSVRKSETGGENDTKTVKKSDLSHSIGESLELKKNSAGMRKVGDRKSEVDGENVTKPVLSHSSKGSRELQKNSSVMRKISDRKSEVDGEHITKAVKKSDLSLSSGESQELRKNSSGTRKISDRKSEVDGEHITTAVKKSDLSLSSGESQELRKNSSGTRKISDRKSEVDGENVTKAVKKSDLSHSSGESQELKKNSAGMRKVGDKKSAVDSENVTKSDLSHSIDESQESKNNSSGMISKEMTNCSIKETKSCAKKRPVGKKKEPVSKFPKLLKEVAVTDAALPERNREERSNDHKNCLGAEKKLLTFNRKQNEEQSQVPATQSANCDQCHENPEPTTKISGGKFEDANLPVKINEDFSHLIGKERPQENKCAASQDPECEVERVLAQIFDSPSKTCNKKIFFNSEDSANDSANAKVTLNYEKKSSKEISEPTSKNSDSSKSCDKQHDLPKDLTKSRHGPKKNGIDSHSSVEVEDKHSKPLSEANHDNSDLISIKKIIGTLSCNSTKESFSSACSRNDEPKQNCKYPSVSGGGGSEKNQRTKSMADIVTDSRVLSIDSEKHANNEKRNCNNPSVSVGGKSDRIQRSKSVTDNAGDSRLQRPLLIDSEKHANSEKRNCNIPTVSAGGKSDEIQRSKSVADNAGDSRLQQPLSIDSEKHANNEKRNCNNPSVSAGGRSDRIQRSKSIADSEGDSRLQQPLLIDSEKHANSEKKNCNIPTVSAGGKSDEIQRSESVADNAGDSRLQQPLSIDSEKHANNEKKNCNIPTVSAGGKSDEIQRSESVADNAGDSRLQQPLSIDSEKHANNEKRNCNNPSVSAGGRSDRIQRSKSIADNAGDSRLQQPLLIDSEKHANSEKRNCNISTVSAGGRSDRIQRNKSIADNEGDSRLRQPLLIDSEKHANSEKRNCNIPTVSAGGKSDEIQRSKSVVDNAGDSRLQQPLLIDSEKHANSEKRNCNIPTISAGGKSDEIQRSKSVADNAGDSMLQLPLSTDYEKHANNGKRSSNIPVSAGGRSDKLQRSKSMADNAGDSRVQQPLLINSEKHAINGKSPSSVKQLLLSYNEREKLTGKTGTPNCCTNKMNEKVSKVVGEISVAKTLNQVDRALKKNKRSLSVGNAPVNSVGELKTIHLVISPESPMSQRQSPPHPVKSKFKKVDGDWVVSTIGKDASSTNTENMPEISSEFPETKEKLHFFAKETVSAGNLSKVIEKCRQKVVASIQMKEKASLGSLLDGNNKRTIDQVVRTPLKTYEPSLCDNIELSKEIDGTIMVQSNLEMIKATSTPKRVDKCQKLSKDEKTGILRKSIQEKDKIHYISLGSNEKCPSPLPGIVAENIDELMREYEQLTNRTAAEKTSTKKKIERRPSQKMLTMFGEEHFVEDCQSILQHPLTSEEKAFPGKKFFSNEVDMGGADHASLADKEPGLTILGACSERVLINDKALSYSKLKAGKKRYLSESLQRKKHFEKGRRYSSGTLSGAEITDRELTAIQSNLLEKSESFTQKQCSVVRTKVSPFNSIYKLDSHGKKLKTVPKNSKFTERQISSEKLCTGEEDDGIAKRSHISGASPKINQSKRLPEIKSSESVAEETPSKCLEVENVCKTRENESIVSAKGGISWAYEANPRDPKLRDNVNVRPEEKESIGGKEKEDSAEIIEAADGKVMSQVLIGSSGVNNPGSPAYENSSNALYSSATVECDKEIAIVSSQTSLLKTVLRRETTDGGNESSVDGETIVCHAKKPEDINSSLLLSLGLLSATPVQPLSSVQDSLENPEYVKKLEQQHEVLEKLVGEAMAQKSLIWKQLQSYHGVVEVKKEVPDDSSDDDCQIIFSAGDMSWIKEDSNSTADTEVIDQFDDSIQEDVSIEGQGPKSSLCETSESGNQKPSLKTSEHSGRKHNSSSNSPTNEFRTGSRELNEKDLKIENSGNVEVENENYSRSNVSESITDSGIAAPDGFISGMNEDTVNLIRNTVPSSTLQQSKDLEVENILAIPSTSQLLTSPEELPVSESNTVIVFCNSNVSRPLLCSPNKAVSTQAINVLDKPETTSDSVRGISPSLQSSDKDSAVESNESNLTGDLVNGRESANLNCSGKTVASVNSTNNTETQVPNNVVSVREERIRVRGMKDLMENPATVSSETAVECQTGKNNYLTECFISEDGVSWFNYLVFYMLKISQKIEEFMDKNSSSCTEISEVEDTFKENCVIIYDLFKRSLVRYKADPNSFITILFMKMVTEWKNFKGLLTLDSLKSVIKKCFGKCLELMSPGKRDKFVAEANELLAKMRIFPPLVVDNQAPVSKRAGISDRAIIRSNPEANEMVHSSNSTTVSFPNVQQPGTIVNNQNNYSYSANNPPRYLETTISQVQQAQRPPLNNQVQMNPYVINSGGVVGQSTIQLPAGHSDSARASMLNNASPSEGQPPSELSTQRNVALVNMNLPSSSNISSLQHLFALTRNSQTRGTVNPGSCSVMNGKPYVLPTSSSVVPIPNILQTSSRNILQSLGSSNLSHQNIPQASSRNILQSSGSSNLSHQNIPQASSRNILQSSGSSNLSHQNIPQASSRNILQSSGSSNLSHQNIPQASSRNILQSSGSSNLSHQNIPQASSRNILQSSGSSNLSHQNITPQSYSPSSSNISSRVYQPMMGRTVFNSASNSVQGSSTQAQNGRAGFYLKTTAQEAHQNALQNNGYGTSGSTSSIPTSSNKPKNPNNALSSRGENVALPQILSAVRPSLLGNYYGANVSSSTVGAVRSSQTSMTASGGVSNATAQQLSSNRLNAMLLGRGSTMTPVSSLSVQGRHRNSSGLGQSVSLPLAINPITRQPIQTQHHPQEQASENNHFPGVNGYQISCQVTVNPSFQYNPNNSRGNLSARDSSESVRTAGQNPTDFSGTPASQHMNVNSIFQNLERNQQIPLRHSLSTTSTLAQSYPEHQLLRSNTHSASRHNPAHDTNSVNMISSSGSDNRRYTLGNLRFQQSGTDVAVVGNSFGQSQIAASNFSAVHTYQQLNRHEASPDNASQLHSSNLQPNPRSDPPPYPCSSSLMKQAEARSSIQLSGLPGPVHPTSPVVFPDDSDQGRGQGTNRSVSRDSGYRSPSQANEVDPCYVCGKEARNTCSGCKSVFYCQHECQMGDWERHKWECRSTN